MASETGFDLDHVEELLGPLLTDLVPYCLGRKARARQHEPEMPFLDPPNMFIFLLSFCRNSIDITTHALRFHIPRKTGSDYLIVVLDFALKRHGSLLKWPSSIDFYIKEGEFAGACAIVDATLTPIEKFEPFEERRKFYTPHSDEGKDSVKTLLLLGFNQRILFVSNVEPGASADSTMWRDAKLDALLGPKLYAIGDSAYSGLKQAFHVTRTDGQLSTEGGARKKALHQCRAAVEHLNHRWKQWEITSRKWRLIVDCNFMTKVFRYVACLVNFDLGERPLHHEHLAAPLKKYEVRPSIRHCAARANVRRPPAHPSSRGAVPSR
jgi:hypothetical protein